MFPLISNKTDEKLFILSLFNIRLIISFTSNMLTRKIHITHLLWLWNAARKCAMSLSKMKHLKRPDIFYTWIQLRSKDVFTRLHKLNAPKPVWISFFGKNLLVHISIKAYQLGNCALNKARTELILFEISIPKPINHIDLWIDQIDLSLPTINLMTYNKNILNYRVINHL